MSGPKALLTLALAAVAAKLTSEGSAAGTIPLEAAKSSAFSPFN